MSDLSYAGGVSVVLQGLEFEAFMALDRPEGYDPCAEFLFALALQINVKGSEGYSCVDPNHGKKCLE